MELKQMIYGSGKSEVLYHEEDNGYGVTILNIRGGHPCAYVTYPGIKITDDYEQFWIDDQVVGPHGGFTFLGTLGDWTGIDGIWLGWDYAHCGDYSWSGVDISLFGCDDDDKRWTTEEILEEARAVLQCIKDGKLKN